MKNLLMLHKRKIGVIFALLVFAFLLVPTTFVLAKDDACDPSTEKCQCPKPPDDELPNLEDIVRNAFTLKLEKNGDDHHYKITMAPNPKAKTKSLKEQYCKQSFRLTTVNGVEYSGADNVLKCDHPLEIYVENLEADTTSGLNGVMVTLMGTNVGKTVDITFDSKSHPCYYDKVQIDLETTVAQAVYHANGCPTYISSTVVDSERDVEIVSGRIDCTKAKTAFAKAFCDAKDKATDVSDQLGTNGKFSTVGMGDNPGDGFSFKCKYNLQGDDPLPEGFAELEGDDYFLNKNYLYASHVEKNVGKGTYKYEYSPGHVKTETISCDIVCEEVVEVEYGPPVATKAGECFEYKVRVTSRVSCGMDKAPKLPEPYAEEGEGEDETPPSGDKCSYCDPTPLCWGYGRYWTQGGPNENFDSCVKSCDGGKYTTKCSTKCYNEVYGSGVSAGAKIKGYSLDLSATKLENSDDVANKEKELKKCITNKLKTLSNSKFGNKAKLAECVCIGEKYGHNGNEWGCYFDDDGNFDSSGGITWEGVRDTNGRGNCKYGSDSEQCKGIEGRWYTNHVNGRYHNGSYIIPALESNGFWRHVYKASSSFPNGYCNDSCWWNDCTNSTTKYINDGYAERDYLNNMVERDKVIATCKAKAKCSTETSEYTISADYQVNGQDSITKTFPKDGTADNIKHNGGIATGSFESENTTILLNYPTKNKGTLGCYSNNDSSTDLYRTTWGFPKAWRNMKTAEISYTKKSGDIWEEIPGRFCLPIDQVGVNVEWWNQYEAKYIEDEHIVIKSTSYEKTECLVENSAYKNKYKDKIVPESKIEFNIRAKTRKFGYFWWNIDMSCFYATNPEPTIFVKKESGDDSNLLEKCGREEEYEVRTVDLENMFPATDGDAVSESGSRKPGFNWSKYATIDKAHGGEYRGNPDKYRTEVETKAKQEGIDYYNDSRLDYQFTITSTELRNLRKRSKELASYGNYVDGKFAKDNMGTYRYYSDLIHTNDYIEKKNVPGKNTKAIECNNMINYQDTSKCDYY